MILLVKPSHVPAAADPNPANVVKSDGAITVVPRAENKPPAAPPDIADCRHAYSL